MNSKVLTLLTLCAVALPARSSVASFDSAAAAAPMVGAEKRIADQYARQFGRDLPALRRQLDEQVDDFIGARVAKTPEERGAYSQLFFAKLRRTLRQGAGDYISDAEFEKIAASDVAGNLNAMSVATGHECDSRWHPRCSWSGDEKRSFRANARGMLDWLGQNRIFLQLRERSHGDPALVLSNGAVNPLLLQLAARLKAQQDSENLKRKVLGQPPLDQDFGLFSTDRGQVLMTWEQARALLAANTALLPSQTLPAAIAGLPAPKVLEWAPLKLTTMVHGGVSSDYYDSAELTKISDWAAKHKTALADALAHPGEQTYTVYDGYQGVVLGAFQKIAAGRGVDAESLVLRPISDPQHSIVSVRSVKEAMSRAYGAVPESDLPPGIEGFPTAQVLLRAKDWLGDDGLAAFRYSFDIGAGETVYYSLPMLKIWAFENRTLLDRVVNKNWPAMPVEKATLWAAQELAVRKGAALDDFLSSTPKAAYLSSALYPEFMAIYRQNKQTLTGEEVAAAIKAFTEQLSGNLNGIRQAIERLDLDTTAQLGNINQSVGSLPGSLNNYGMDLSLTFGRRVWGRR